jgi:activator of HSP90 ATPase
MPKTVSLAATLSASPEKIYGMYLDATAHSAFTGQPAEVAPREGAGFSAFGGILTGKILHLSSTRMIVQSWRSANWTVDDLDSILVLTLFADGNGTRVELQQLNVPDNDFAGVCHGWEKYYWAPWRTYLDAHRTR